MSESTLGYELVPFLILALGSELITLTRYPLKLLLRLRPRQAWLQAGLTVLICSRCRARLESDLLALGLDVQFWPRHFDFVALLTDALVADIVTLILVLFLMFFYLQMPINKSRGKLIFGNSCREQLGNPAAQEWLLEDFTHRGSLRWILNQHQLNQVLQILRVMRWDLRVAPPENLEDQSLHRIGIKSMPEGNHFIENTAE